MKSADYECVREHLGLKRKEFAGVLGIDVRTSRGYEYEDHPIPRYIALACWALVMRPRIADLTPNDSLRRWLGGSDQENLRLMVAEIEEPT